MGKKKKSGKGAEKTAIKTEKKAEKKLKKELAAKGEEDIEKLIAEFKKQDVKKQQVIEEPTTRPSLRSGMTVCPHPDKEELLLFGGEYFNGNKTLMYNDLYVYNIKKDQWMRVTCPGSPPPRSSHQAVVTSQGGGQMWIFGGEFASPTRSQFYHYRDLWVYHCQHKKWEHVDAPGGPSARSGHRMVVCRRKIILFGGFHESTRDYKYFNDVYAFDLDTYQWSKLDPVGTGPTPRSACQLAATSEGKIIAYGGYSREKTGKKDVDRGIVHTDLFILQQESKGGIERWRWTQVKQSGMQPSPRCGSSLCAINATQALLFGGVHDEEDEEILEGTFYNDAYLLEMEKGRWKKMELRGIERDEKKKRRKEKKEEQENDDENDVEMSIEGSQVQTTDDGVFTVTIGPSSSTSDAICIQEDHPEQSKDIFVPHTRMNGCMAVKHSQLYLYGGIYEVGDRQVTLSDLNVLDLHKMDTWKVLLPLDAQTQEWLESESESDGEEMDVEGACGGGHSSEDDEDEDDDS